MEFDKAMNRLRTAQSELTQPLRDTREKLNNRRREIGRHIAALNIELGCINRERDTLNEEIHNIGSIFYGLKKEMIQMNPKNVPTET